MQTKKAVCNKIYLHTLFVILISVMLLICIDASAASSGTCGDGITWSLSDNGVFRVSGNGYMADYSFSDTKRPPWYADRSLITSVVISSGVKNIGDYTFTNCTNLSSVSIPKSVTSIGNSAFSGCTSLNSISIPNSVTSIGNSAFRHCTGFTSFTIPNSVTEILDSAFNECSNLATVYLPNGLTVISNYLFYHCTNLQTVNIPASVTSINFAAFTRCRKLVNIDIPDGVLTIGDFAFEDCSTLANVTIPNSVTTLGECVFRGCSGMQSITIPSSVTKIGENYAYSEVNTPIPVTAIIIIPQCNSYIHRWAKTNRFSFEIVEHQQVVQDPIVTPTCTLTGLTVGSHCEECGEILVRQESIASLGHVVVVDCYVAPTDTQSGLTEGSHCSRCETILIEQRVIHPLVWSLINSEDGLVIQKYYGSQEKLTIPESIDGTLVTGIADNAFVSGNCPSKVFIPNTIVAIGTAAFAGTPMIYCFPYSEADFWADENGYQTVYTSNAATGSFYDVDIIDELRLMVGDSHRIEANVFPQFTEVGYNWSSNFPDIVSIDQSGNAVGLYPGMAMISLSVGGVTKTVSVTAYCLPESFELSTSEISIVSKDSFQIEIVNISPRDADMNIAWTSSDTSLATVDQSGKITAKRFGDVIITATQDNIVRTCLVHVRMPVTSVSFNESEYSVILGKSIGLSAIVISDGQEYLNQMVSFESDNDAIVSVNSIGIATAHGYGTVTITASSSNGYSATCEVKVLPPASVSTLPSNLAVIGSEAFVGLDSTDAIRIPASVTSIAPDAFDPSMTLIVPAGSKWVQWGLRYGYTIVEE